MTTDPQAAVALAALTAAEEQLDPKSEAILDAARALLLKHGLRRTALSDIARAAGISDATLYRRFANRDQLLGTLLAREARALIARADEQVSKLYDPVERMVTAFLVFARFLRDHQLIQSLLDTDPETVLPMVTIQGAPLIAIGTHYITVEVKRAQDAGVQLTARPDQIAELFARIAHSLVLTRHTTLPLDDDEQTIAFARATLAPLFKQRGA
jgi:AcrR family transcriptional regulator